jgi:hypothetical protein
MTPVEPRREVGDGPQPLPTEDEIRDSMQWEPEMTKEPGRDHTLKDR